MGYYMTIAGHDLKYEGDILTKVHEYLESNELYLPWNYCNGCMDLDDNYFKWSSDFIKDLLILRSFGVRGNVICYG